MMGLGKNGVVLSACLSPWTWAQFCSLVSQQGWPSFPSLWMGSLSPCCGGKSQVLPLPAFLGIPNCKNLPVADSSRRSSRLSSPPSSLGWAVPCPASLHPPWSGLPGPGAPVWDWYQPGWGCSLELL